VTIKLLATEAQSAAWDKVVAHTEIRLKALRLTAENPRVTDAERLAAAWRINEIKELLKLAQPASDKEPEGFAD
jgi:hypothetical protein